MNPKPAAMVLALLVGSALQPPTRLPAAPDTTVTWGVAPAAQPGQQTRPAFDYVLDPGAVLTDRVVISNYTDQTITFRVYASDALTTAHGGFDLLPAGARPADVGGWVRFAGEMITVPGRSRTEVPFQLTVPANATPGDHAGGIVASLATSGADGVTVDRRVGSRIYLRVTGELRPALEIVSLDVSYAPTLNPLRPGALTVTYTLHNTGNVRLTGGPGISVTGPFGWGRRSAAGSGVPEILPGGSATATVPVTGVFPLGRLTAEVAVAPAAVGVESAPAPPEVRRAISIWAVPWVHLGLLLLLCLAAGLILWWRRRSIRARAEAAS